MQFAQYCTCYGLDAETKANVFSFHLQDHARIWYNSLSDSIKNNWWSLEAAFKQCFNEDRDTLDLSNLQIDQLVYETVLDYLCRLQKNAALNPKVDDNLLLAIAVNGLRSEIRYSRTHPNKMYLIHRINLKQALPKKNTIHGIMQSDYLNL